MFGVFFSLYYYTLEFVFLNNKRRVFYRLKKYIPKELEDPFDTPFILRLVQPLIQRLSETLNKLTPVMYRNYLQERLSQLEKNYRIEEILFLKFLTFALFLLSLLLSLHILNSLILTISLFVIVFFIPDLLINSSVEKRRKKIQSELPYLMEVLVVILEGGLAFDSAIQKICERKTGPLYSEFHRYIQQVKMGSSKKEALTDMVKRVQLPEFESFVRAILQGDKSGVSIVTTIKIQSEHLRSKQKQQWKEQAMKIPIKILFPLIFFIFPPTFLVILGPGIVRIINELF